MTYAKSIVIAAVLIAGSILLSKIAVSQQTVDTSNRPVLNIALAQAVEESSAMQDRASWVWVMQGNKLYACRITLKPGGATESSNSPECTDPTEFN